MAKAEQTTNASGAFLIAIWAAILLTVFVAFRSTDLLRLPSLIGDLGGGPLFGAGIVDSLMGAFVALLILASWFGLGTFLFRFVDLPRSDEHSHVLELVRNIAAGAAVWSLIFFFLGLAGLYNPTVATICVAVGLGLSIIGMRRVRDAKGESRTPEGATGFDKALLVLIGVPVLLAFVAALAPPIAKDTLLYHFAVPKAFIAQNSNAYVDGNIASHLALGTEMHTVWAMLVGNIVSTRAGEAAAGVTTFLFFPLLLAAVFGWARETGISRRWALIAALLVAAVPTAYHVASSGYIDVALALFVTLAVYSLCLWCKDPSTGAVISIGIFLGAALAVKLTTVFVIAAFALVILLWARKAENTGKVVASGFGALVLAGAIASPWYLRNWVATGSPVFPFYMSIWEGKADGWDVERSNLFQAMNSQYGGADVSKTNYLTAPLRVSVAAQPENPELYDGVLGAALLIGLPLLIFAAWKRGLADEIAIAAGVAVIVYLFWLFSSSQLRYLLPIVPLLAIAITGAAESTLFSASTRKAAMYSLSAAAFVAALTSFAWFCQAAPLRVALGGESPDQYLARNLDYYPYYQAIDAGAPADAKVWLINMRRDTYHIGRPYVSDYLFEDWTLRRMLWESRTAAELKAKAAAMNVQYILTRHDFLFDYDRSTLVDDKRPRSENEAKLTMARELVLDPARTIKADDKFSLVKVF